MLAAAAVTAVTGFVRADAMVSVAIGLIILPRAVKLLGRRYIMDVDHVRDVHDLHVYTVTSGLPVLTAHVVVDPECFGDGHAPRMLDAVQACLAGHFDVEHSTIQLEPAGHADHEHPTHA